MFNKNEPDELFRFDVLITISIEFMYVKKNCIFYFEINKSVTFVLTVHLLRY